jgi:protein-tyrosine-phosphatase
MVNSKPELMILFVCTGNACRSPLAAALLRRELAGEPVRVESAGIAAALGAPASALAQQVGAELGVDLTNHQARPVDREIIRSADLILVMESAHREKIVQLEPNAGSKVMLLGGYPDREMEIEDPMGRSIEFYRQTALLLKAAILRVAREIRRQLEKGF